MDLQVTQVILHTQEEVGFQDIQHTLEQQVTLVILLTVDLVAIHLLRASRVIQVLRDLVATLLTQVEADTQDIVVLVRLDFLVTEQEHLIQILLQLI